MKKIGEKGQSTVEFALTMILIMAFTLFYFQLAMVFGYGNYAHYATFIAARAYLASGPDQPDQINRAKDVLITMLQKSSAEEGVSKFPQLAHGEALSDCKGDESVVGTCIGPSSQFVDGNRTQSWLQGVRYSFRSRLFMIPLAGMNSAAKVGFGPSTDSILLTSESWLGREPTEQECQLEMGKRKGIFDNGC